MPTHEPRCTDDRSPNRNYDDPLVQPEHQLKPRMHLNPDAHHCSCSKCKTGYQKGADGVCVLPISKPSPFTTTTSTTSTTTAFEFPDEIAIDWGLYSTEPDLHTWFAFSVVLVVLNWIVQC